MEGKDKVKTNLNESKYVRKQLSKKLRKSVWDKYIGSDVEQSKCLCCNSERITIKNFQCGHIESVKNNGNDSIDNLRPICGYCNQHMGIQNMVQYQDNIRYVNDITNNLYFNKHNHIITLNSNEHYYKVNSNNIKTYIEKWEHNRDLDNDKITMILNAFENKKLSPGIIYIAELNDKFICYDGNHRIEALNNINCDLICHVIFNATDKMIKNNTQNINKMTPTPDAILANSAEGNILLNQFIKDFNIKYGKQKVQGKNPFKGNYNSNILFDKISRLLFDNPLIAFDEAIKHIHIDVLMNIFDKINEEYKSMTNNNKYKQLGITDRQYNKSIKNNCYIFLIDFELIFTRLIQDQLNSIKHMNYNKKNPNNN